MVKIPGMFQENEQYKLIPGDHDHWHIRILQGDFIESVISFGKISVNEESLTVNFEMTLHYSPDDTLTSDNIELQKYAGRILESVIVNNLNEAENQ